MRLLFKTTAQEDMTETPLAHRLVLHRQMRTRRAIWERCEDTVLGNGYSSPCHKIITAVEMETVVEVSPLRAVDGDVKGHDGLALIVVAFLADVDHLNLSLNTGSVPAAVRQLIEFPIRRLTAKERFRLLPGSRMPSPSIRCELCFVGVMGLMAKSAEFDR